MRFNKRKAFTVTEMIVVLSSIAILFLGLLSKIDISGDKARVATVQTDFRAYYTAAQKVILEVPNIEAMTSNEFENALNANLDPSLRFTNRQSEKLDPWFQHYRYGTGMIGDKFCIIFASEGDEEKYRFKTSDMGGVDNVFLAAEGEEEEETEDFVPRITLAFAVVDGDIFTLDEKEHEIMETNVSDLESPITGSIEDITVAEGAEFTFTVNIVGDTSGLSYTWYRSGDLIPDENSSSLTMVANERFDGDRFVCYIEKNGKVYATNTAKLTVLSNVLTNVKIKTMPVKLDYFEGQSFSDIGLTLEATYSNGTVTTVTDYTIENGLNLRGDQTSVKVSWQGWNFDIPITVTSETPIGISLSQLPDKTNYIETQDFDKTGMVVVVEYNNGAKEIVTDFTVTGGTKLKAGTPTVTISYGGFSQAIKVNVVKLQVTHLEVTNPPVKTRYLVGKNFELNGLEVKATWNNGMSKIVTNVSGSTPNGAGYTPITNGYTVVDGKSLKESQTSVKLKMDNATVLVPIEVYVHEHTGQAGLSYANGCYTKPVETGGYCRGYQSKATWHGCSCGRSWPCAGDGSGGNDDYGHSEVYKDYYKTKYHTTKSTCNEWTATYTYEMDCGYPLNP